MTGFDHKSGPRGTPRGAIRTGRGSVSYLEDAVPLTSNEIHVLAALLEEQAARGRPSLRGAARRCQCSPATATAAIRRLADLDLVTYEPGKEGTMRLRVRIVR